MKSTGNQVSDTLILSLMPNPPAGHMFPHTSLKQAIWCYSDVDILMIIESSACSSGFKNEDEIHFFLACQLYYRPRVTLLNALAHIAPLTVKTLLYGNDTFEFEENKIIIAETLRFIKESKRFDWCYIYLIYQLCCV